jgi:hypothetical protein
MGNNYMPTDCAVNLSSEGDVAALEARLQSGVEFRTEVNPYGEMARDSRHCGVFALLLPGTYQGVANAPLDPRSIGTPCY